MCTFVYLVEVLSNLLCDIDSLQCCKEGPVVLVLMLVDLPQLT